MTPSADPTFLHVIMESAGNSDGISAVWATVLASLIGALISGVVAVATTKANLKHSNERHTLDLKERRTERVFNTKLNTATELIESLNYLSTSETKAINGVKLSQHAERVKVLLPKVSFLFSSISIPNDLVQKAEELHEITSLHENRDSEWERIKKEITDYSSMEYDLIGYTDSFLSELRKRGEIMTAREQFKKAVAEREKLLGSIKVSIKENTEQLTEALRKELGIHL